MPRQEVSFSLRQNVLALMLLVVLTTGSMIPWHHGHMSGCGRQHAPGYHDASAAQSIFSVNYTRYYGVYVPQSYNDNPWRKRKLIFDYHGNGGTPENQYNNSQYFKYPAGEEYLAVYPAGVNGSWESAGYSKGVDDLQFTTDLLAHIQQLYCVDSDHVYASGKSNGGGFVDLLACSDNGDEFAAFAMASAALYSDNSLGACSKHRAILESHGENDTTIPYDGGVGKGGHLPDIDDWVEWWVERDGCPASDKGVTMQRNGYDVVSYTCDGYCDVVQHYKVFDLGHCWPSSTGDNSDGARSYCYDHVLDYTPVVLDFFSRWDLGNAPRND